ncbi:MAG: hypothetical protein WCG87_10165 [Bacteroidota bacterium]
MARNFTKRIPFEGKTVFASFIPEMRKNGLYFEVNVTNIPRFYMTWSPLGRFDIVPQEGLSVPYDLILALSDVLEKQR